LRLRSPAALLAALLAGTAPAAEVDLATMLSREAAREWRAVGRVNVAGTGDRSQCTGTLIAPDVVLTAAHCLVHPGSGLPFAEGNVHFVAGWYGGEMTGHARAAAFAIHPGYRPGDRTRDGLGTDVALIRLRDPLPHAAAPPFAVGTPPLPGAPLTLVSYRRDRAHAPTLQDGCPYETVTGPLLLLVCPVTFGASGAPVFAEIDGERRVVGVLAAMSGDLGEPVAIAVRADTAVAMLLESLPEGG
jgi:protease YdgD